MRAKKHFGQNFLIDQLIIKKIADDVTAKENDLIIEIGPGRGALTEVLKEKNTKLIAYEIDTDLKPYLNKLENDNFKVIYNDILKSNIKEDINNIPYNNLFIVGNLPYYITTPIVEYITKSGITFNNFTIMVQREVADRFLASPKTREYGYFTIYLQYFYDISRVVNVDKKAFDPAPKVNSAVISLKPNKKYDLDETKFFDFIKKCFREKRKNIKNNLKEYNKDILLTFLNNNGYNENTRSEEITLNHFIELFKLLEN